MSGKYGGIRSILYIFDILVFPEFLATVYTVTFTFVIMFSSCTFLIPNETPNEEKNHNCTEYNSQNNKNIFNRFHRSSNEVPTFLYDVNVNFH